MPAREPSRLAARLGDSGVGVARLDAALRPTNMDMYLHLSYYRRRSMISQTAEYALRAVVYLAREQSEGCTTRALANATRVPAGYLSKVIQSLVRAGLVVSQRGLGGGFRLARPATELTAWDVLEAVDPLRRINGCPLGLEAHRQQLCPLHRRLDDAMELVERSFRETSVQELIDVPPRRRAGCAFPCTAAPER
jgi:Rrf2 family nitric oxide-sensitive transcriptional repressor